ncbi:TIGR04076 family protein [Acidaminobacter sp. JC074]|uniref:TIGR04076 family protein n=1 Tax=Acidaminobacter sp. JC074 TaxID=2530199 RepID=UPI001F0D7D1E|nr:TIGR04076 family protein [Acidaminobacter sp. JC074]MCH4886262.1 TIGR04076 family protein [Acidaminobacter sp. JC074]
MKVKLTITDANCRCGYHHEGEEHIVGDLCPPICHELWQCIYPSVYVLMNGGILDYGNDKAKKFIGKCPDGGRVEIMGEVVE